MQPTVAPPPYAVLIGKLFASWESFSIAAVARLGVADYLESGPKTTAQLAAELKVHEDSLYRVLRALAGSGIFREGEGRTFSQTPLSAVLRSNAAPGLRYFSAMSLDDWYHRGFQAVCKTIENGRTGMENVFGMELFEHLQKNPGEAENFNKGMTDLSSSEAPAVVASYDFGGFEHIVDVGGGMGSLLAAILESAPQLRGTLFDMPYLIEQARTAPILSPYAGRCDFAGGDFFENVTAGADAYIMKHIIHDWDDERSAKILSNCHKAMRPGGKLLVVDRVIGPPNQPDQKKYFDIAMMMWPGGRERDEAEWRALFQASGFRLEQIIPTPSPHSILEGAPL
jgi:SAM-dependent methyltransferase